MESTVDPRVESYLREALSLLDDVAAEHRQELAESIEEAMLEVAAESDRDLPGTLGAPAEFVAELRQASGLGPPTRRRRLFASGRRLASARGRITSHGAWAWSERLARELRPAWWVVRAGAVLWLVAELMHPWRSVSWFGPVPVPALVGTQLLDVLVLGAAVYGSVELGRRSPSGWERRGMILINGIAAVALIVGGLTLSDRTGGASFAHPDPLPERVADRVAWVHGRGMAIPIRSVDGLERLVADLGTSHRSRWSGPTERFTNWLASPMCSRIRTRSCRCRDRYSSLRPVRARPRVISSA